MSSNSSDDPSDQELVQRVRHGDKEAFDRLFSRYDDSLCRYIYRKVKNQQDMQDIAQQTYKKIYTFLSTSSEEIQSFKGLLYTTAKNTIRDHFRALKRRPPSAEGSPQEDQEDIGGRVEELVIQAELMALAWEEIRKKLTHVQMRCFIWDLERVKIEEIARRLNLSKKTVRAYLGKVKAELRQAFRRLQRRVEGD